MILAAIACNKTQSELARAMRRTGISIVSAPGVREADHVLAAGRVSVVLVDKDLPGGGWRELVRVVDELIPQPVIVVTGLSAEDYRFRGEVLNSGGFDVLPRPLETRETLRVLMHAYRESRVRKRGAPMLSAALAS